MHWNVVLAIFQHNHICQDCWKNTRSTFECMIIFTSRGQGPKKIENYGTNLSCTFNKNLDLVPLIREKPYTQMLIWYFPTILTHMIMLENCENNISVYGFSSIQGTKFYSRWNLMKPGSQSGTYLKDKNILKGLGNRQKNHWGWSPTCDMVGRGKKSRGEWEGALTTL